MDVEIISSEIIRELGDITGREVGAFTSDSQLIGQEGCVKSRELVELLLFLEEWVETEMGVEFDWTSDSAFSISRSIFRTIKTLATHIADLKRC